MTVHPTIQDFQKSSHSIGMFDFMDQEQALKCFPHRIAANYKPIGLVEADLLCIDEPTDQPLLLEHETVNRIFCLCAKTQSHFVEALHILEEYFDRCGSDEGFANNESAGLDVINRATAAAGGDKYNAIYHSIVGY